MIRPIECFGCPETGPPVAAQMAQRGIYTEWPDSGWPEGWVLLGVNSVQKAVMAFCGEEHAADFFTAWLAANRKLDHSALDKELAVDATAKLIKRYAAKARRGPGVDQARRDYFKGLIMSGCCRPHAGQAYNAGWKEAESMDKPLPGPPPGTRFEMNADMTSCDLVADTPPPVFLHDWEDVVTAGMYVNCKVCGTKRFWQNLDPQGCTGPQ